MIFPETPISEVEITELIELYNLIDFEIFAEYDRIFLNPHFNDGSRRVLEAWMQI